MNSIAAQYDCLLLDLDGTVFRGHRATEGAVDSLDAIDSRKLFVTNNASRSADEVAAHLRELGFTAGSDDVVTSAQSAAHLLAAQLPPGSKVLIVGTDALADEISAAGLRPVRRFEDGPDAVVQGLSMTIAWPELAEAALAIRAGALWVAANVDLTLPTERGLLPGNGSLVAALRAATGGQPQVAGKPGPQLMKDAVGRGKFAAPLVVGDRLDTDIEGANAAELPSLMVLTGVNSARDAVFAQPAQRPTFIGHDLRSLHQDSESLRVGPQPGWRVEFSDEVATVTATDHRQDDDLAIVRAVASAVWDASAAVRIEAGDNQARDALDRWSLMRDE
ncbi:MULTISPECIES: HAD-IIA family hydrolase [Mycobacterium]|uniref:HAD family hydrolase n=1 Tax=Mycobacterium gordonae TaxID=1778 RepID=A0A1A6B9J6_MYCGO|nr:MULTISPECIES: HAD-IIA family hydrolase [Mycobacterium]MBI2697780.1 HAD-IIA family hydrolase [Mycobacterium sp.]MCQ4363963.1 HAD-IIA family hydrolase [Mycobacterium gordonae]MCV7004757.1 HAD-IIA family hydrolase [Mycobacterium gordonae]OBR98965.1 HAD family hydrolase [Mycobacterium gordonae]ODR15884.1 HAD family hydrolase [Mycobacterium gordonae]